MISVHIPICISCTNIYRYDKVLCCNAFPNGIPDNIWNEEKNPLDMKECNNGIGFEPKEQNKD